LPFLWSFGAELTDANLTQWRLTGSEAEAAFSFYQTLANRRICPREHEVPQLFQDTGFLTGKVAMCVNGPWFQPFLEKTQLADAYFVVPIPRGPAGRYTRITWDGIVIATHLPTERRTRASQFLRYVVSKAVQDRIGQSGRALPARMASTDCFVHGSPDPRRATFVASVSYSRMQPLVPRFGELDRVMNKYFADLLDPAGQWTVHAVLERLARDPVVRSVFPSSPLSKP